VLGLDDRAGKILLVRFDKGDHIPRRLFLDLDGFVLGADRGRFIEGRADRGRAHLDQRREAFDGRIQVRCVLGNEGDVAACILAVV